MVSGPRARWNRRVLLSSSHASQWTSHTTCHARYRGSRCSTSILSGIRRGACNWPLFLVYKHGPGYHRVRSSDRGMEDIPSISLYETQVLGTRYAPSLGRAIERVWLSLTETISSLTWRPFLAFCKSQVLGCAHSVFMHSSHCWLSC